MIRLIGSLDRLPADPTYYCPVDSKHLQVFPSEEESVGLRHGVRTASHTLRRALEGAYCKPKWPEYDEVDAERNSEQTGDFIGNGAFQVGDGYDLHPASGFPRQFRTSSRAERFALRPHPGKRYARRCT